MKPEYFSVNEAGACLSDSPHIATIHAKSIEELNAKLEEALIDHFDAEPVFDPVGDEVMSLNWFKHDHQRVIDVAFKLEDDNPHGYFKTKIGLNRTWLY